MGGDRMDNGVDASLYPKDLKINAFCSLFWHLFDILVYICLFLEVGV